MKKLALTMIGLGILLHFYTAFFESSEGVDSFSLKLMFWSWLPYLICLALILIKKNPAIILGGVTLPLVMDSINFYWVFINPTSSTGALGLLFMPLWNLVLFMPAGVGLVFGAVKLIEKRGNKNK